MGANDNILADGDEGGTDTTATTTTTPTATPPTIDPAVLTKAVNDGLAGVDAKLNQFGSSVQQYVQQALQGAQQRVEQGTATRADTDLTQRLLDPAQAEAAIGSVVEKILKAQLAPTLTAQTESAYEDQLDRQRALVDGRWGPGSFDELILPEVESVVAQTPNAGAKATRNYINTLVQLATGKPETLDKLIARQTKWQTEKKAEDTDMDTGGVLDAGRRRRASTSVLSDEDRAFMADVAAHTGEDIDMKRVEETKRVMDKHGFIDAQVMPGAKNKLPIKGQRHSQKGAAA